MKIVVCFKNVPDEREAKIDAQRNVDLSGASLSIGTYDLNAVEAGAILAEAKVDAQRNVDLSGASLSIGTYDLNAVEAGAILAEADGSAEYIALTAGDARSAGSKLKKDVLARGPQRLVVRQDESLAQADALATAKALAAGIREIGDVDLVLFGAGSGDRYNQQVGSLVGAILGIPYLNEVCSIERDGDALTVERTLEGMQEHLRVSMPCAITVTADINTPRISGVKAVLAAGKKPMDVVDCGAVPAATEVESLLAPEKADRKRVVFQDTSDENVEEFFQALRKAL